MRLDVDGKTFMAHFRHEITTTGALAFLLPRFREYTGFVPAPNDKDAHRRITWCTGHFGPCAKNDRPCHTPGEVTSWAVFNPMDKIYLPQVGRRVALGRVLLKLVPDDQSARKAVWAAYLKRIGFIVTTQRV